MSRGEKLLLLLMVMVTLGLVACSSNKKMELFVRNETNSKFVVNIDILNEKKEIFSSVDALANPFRSKNGEFVDYFEEITLSIEPFSAEVTLIDSSGNVVEKNSLNGIGGEYPKIMPSRVGYAIHVGIRESRGSYEMVFSGVL